MRKISAVGVGLLAIALALGSTSSARAAHPDYFYGTFNGTNYDFVGVEEHVQTADDLTALFEAPVAIGDQLKFSPSSFDAFSVEGPTDTTHSLLNTSIVSKYPTTAFIDMIKIEEAGDIILSPTGANWVYASLSGTVTITGALNTSFIGEIITFGGFGGDFDTIFTPGPSTNFLYIAATTPPPVIVSWDGTVLIDVASLFPGVTSVDLALNNYLQADSDPGGPDPGDGSTALIQKKTVSGPKITVIPEPGTAALVLCGLLGLALRARPR